MPTESDTHPWWLELMQERPNNPVVFLKLPFLNSVSANQQGFAIANVLLEETPHCLSLLGVITQAGYSLSSLQEALKQAGLQANLISQAQANGTRAYLFEVRGYVSQSENFNQFCKQHAEHIFSTTLLGAYTEAII